MKLSKYIPVEPVICISGIRVWIVTAKIITCSCVLRTKKKIKLIFPKIDSNLMYEMYNSKFLHNYVEYLDAYNQHLYKKQQKLRNIIPTLWNYNIAEKWLSKKVLPSSMMAVVTFLPVTPCAQAAATFKSNLGFPPF